MIAFRVVWLRYKSAGRLSLPQEGADRPALMAFPWLRVKSTMGWPGEQDVQASEEHGVNVQEIARQDPGCLGGQELPPGR